MKQENTWEKADAEKIGSYLVFEITGNESEFAAVSTMSVWWIWTLAGILLVAVFIVAIKIIGKFIKAIVHLVNKRR